MSVYYISGKYLIEDLKNLRKIFDNKEITYINYEKAEIDDYIKILIDSFNDKNSLNAKKLESNYLENIKSFFLYFKNLFLFSRLIFKKTKNKMQKKFFYNDILINLYLMGVKSIFIVAFISFFLGISITYQACMQLKNFGFEIYGINLLIGSFLKEMGLMVSMIVLCGKSSSSMIAKIGFMKITQEWDMLKIMGIDPEIFFLKTKIISFIILLPFLGYISAFFGMLGGYVLLKFLMEVNFILFIELIKESLTLNMLLAILIKGLVLGFTIGIVTSYEASLIKNHSDNIIIRLSQGVIISILFSFFLDTLLNLLVVGL